MVPTSGTQCACQHLTDFSSSSAPKISMCSAKDLMSLSPGEFGTSDSPTSLLFDLCAVNHGGNRKFDLALCHSPAHSPAHISAAEAAQTHAIVARYATAAEKRGSGVGSVSYLFRREIKFFKKHETSCPF